MDEQNQIIQSKRNGCWSFIVATLAAFVVGAGICIGGVVIFFPNHNSTFWFSIWMGACFMVPTIVWFWLLMRMMDKENNDGTRT